MKKTKLIPGVIFVATLLASGVSAYADVVLTFDEKGSGNLCTGGATTNCWALVGANPNIGFTGFLTYFFPAGVKVTAGDVKITEPPSSTDISDGLRFTNAAGALHGAGVADRMFYYSDQTDGITSLGDTGFPGNFYTGTNKLTIKETGLPPACGPYTSDLFNGFCYTPAAGNPGFHAGVGAAFHYNGTSDSPESGVPFELALGPCGVLLCGILLRKRLLLN
jgi:hypothetical protein